MRCHVAAFLLSMALAAPVPAATLDSLETLPARQALPALVQRLMGALPADSAVWQRLLSDSAVYLDESGEVLHKRELLGSFRPFPAGIHGSIDVTQPEVIDLGDVATCVFTANEREEVFGQSIAVGYRGCHTWRRESGRWRLVSAGTLVLARDPAPYPVTAATLRRYVGHYVLGNTRTFHVEARGDTLFGRSVSGARTRLIPIGENVFVDAGDPLAIVRIFVRGANGTFDRMIQRRKFADLVWRKAPVAMKQGRGR